MNNPAVIHAARMLRPHRFPETRCSQCGADLGSGNSGVSHCSDHVSPAPGLMHQIVHLSNELAMIEEQARRDGLPAAAAQIREAGVQLMRALRHCGTSNTNKENGQ